MFMFMFLFMFMFMFRKRDKQVNRERAFELVDSSLGWFSSLGLREEPALKLQPGTTQIDA
jgi:hypothetical protein